MQYKEWYNSLNSDFQIYLAIEHNIDSASTFEDLQRVGTLDGFDGEVDKELLKPFKFLIENHPQFEFMRAYREETRVSDLTNLEINNYISKVFDKSKKSV